MTKSHFVRRKTECKNDANTQIQIGCYSENGYNSAGLNDRICMQATRFGGITFQLQSDFLLVLFFRQLRQSKSTAIYISVMVIQLF